MPKKNLRQEWLKATPYTKALLGDGFRFYTWPDRKGVPFQKENKSPLQLSYSFAMPPITQEMVTDIRRFPTSDIFALSPNNRKLAKKAMRSWEKIANLKFVETTNPINAQIIFIETGNNPHSDDGAFTIRSINSTSIIEPLTNLQEIPVVTVLQNRNYLLVYSYHVSPYYEITLLSFLIHELGHVLGLEHPFARLNANITHSTTLSIMNYEVHEYQIINRRIRAQKYKTISPTAHDIAAVQLLYGPNQHSEVKNNLYNLTARAAYFNKLLENESQKEYLNYYALETIFDKEDTNTLSAKHAEIPVILNLNGGNKYRSTLGQYQVTLVHPFHNAIGGNKENTIILNSLDNIVDLRSSFDHNTIVTAPSTSGNDIILNFKSTDTIILEQSIMVLNQLSWSISPVLSTTWVTVDNENIDISSGIHIDFGRNNTLTITGIPVEKINRHTITVQKVLPNELLGKQIIFSQKPHYSVHENCETLRSSTISGLIRTLTLDTVESGLKAYGFKETSIENFEQMAIFAIGFYTNTLFPAHGNFLTYRTCRLAGFSRTTAQNIGFAVGEVIQQVNLSLPGISVGNMVAGIAGQYVGNYLARQIGFFAKKGITKLPSHGQVMHAINSCIGT